MSTTSRLFINYDYDPDTDRVGGLAEHPLHPLYVPPDIVVAWARVNADGNYSDSVEALKAKGYLPVPEKDKHGPLVTRDVHKARREGIIALRYYTTDASGYVRYGDLILMATPREVWEKRQREMQAKYSLDVKQAFEQEVIRSGGEQEMMSVESDDSPPSVIEKPEQSGDTMSKEKRRR